MESFRKSSFILLQLLVSSAWAYTNLTPAQVHQRLVLGDTLMLLDVREVSEYRDGHIAEPAGQLPMTPVNMPWNSNILTTEYQRLPKDIDIVVYCRGGGRSVSASIFLESKGFTRIYNMTGGFLAWTFDKRTGGYGDHSGRWVHSFENEPVVMTCTGSGAASSIIFLPGVLFQPDSIYFELHFASGRAPIPPAVPESELAGLFRITALDRFGRSWFTGDSLVLSDTAKIDLAPVYPVSGDTSLIHQNMTIYVPGAGWRDVSFTFDRSLFHRDETILRRWYNVEGSVYTGINVRSQSKPVQVLVFPNPFNSVVRIQAPLNAEISVYDTRGRYIKKLSSHTWIPAPSLGSGIYFITIRYQHHLITRKVTYLK